MKDYLDNREYIIAGKIDDYRGEYGDGYYGIGLKSQSAMTKMRRRNEIEKCDLQGIILVTHCDLFDVSLAMEIPKTEIDKTDDNINKRLRVGRSAECMAMAD